MGFAILIGAFFGVGFYLATSRHLLRFVFGLLLMGQAANLFVFMSGGLSRGLSPIIEESAKNQMPETLSQALILTAIVIGFAMTAFFVVLARQCFLRFGSDDVSELGRFDP
ncbi:MAG: NADH-quinone oxidoreductase subunit K [Bdellovibrionaceae bacterium]|nr:NADH-quinone oxidoreductase subunit K [Pseudobdellovibrionaceae bacterium]